MFQQQEERGLLLLIGPTQGSTETRRIDTRCCLLLLRCSVTPLGNSTAEGQIITTFARRKAQPKRKNSR